MTRGKTPLPKLIEANKKQAGIIFGWREFKAIAEQEKRPSYKALSKIFKKSDVTMKTWLERFDKEESQ